MENPDEFTSRPRQMHGCVIAYLIIIIIFNSIIALVYFFASGFIAEALEEEAPVEMIVLLGVLCLLNVLCASLLLAWKKVGFWGFVLTSIGALIINLQLGLSVFQSVIGLAGIIMLWAVLQFRAGDESAWNNLE